MKSFTYKVPKLVLNVRFQLIRFIQLSCRALRKLSDLYIVSLDYINPQQVVQSISSQQIE